MVKRGYDAEKIYNVLMEVKMQSDIFIMVDTLKYLKKGGRITPAAAAVGGVLKIKPVLLIKGEKLDKYRMMNRTIENAKRIMIEACKECIDGYLKDIDGNDKNVRIALAYTGVDKTQINSYVEMVKKEFGLTDVLCNPLSLSVSCHIGTGALAITVTKCIPE